MIISSDFPELIFIAFCTVHLAAMSTVHLAAMSTDSWITETPFLSHTSNKVLSSTYFYNGTGFLNRLCKLGNIWVQTGFPVILSYLGDQNASIHFLFLPVEFCLIKCLIKSYNMRGHVIEL